MSTKNHRHNNKFNKKVTCAARKDVKINAAWFRAYQECIKESQREVWIVNFRHAKPADLIAF